MSSNEEELVELFKYILSESKAKETIKNVNLSTYLEKIIRISKKKDNNIENKMILYHLASKLKPQIENQLEFLLDYICTNKINTTIRLDAALEYLLNNLNKKINIEDFEKSCGVGVNIDSEEIETTVLKLINQNKTEILAQRYRFNFGLIMQEARNQLKWVDGKILKNEVDLQILDLLGQKTEEDKKPLPKVKTPKVPSISKEVKVKEEATPLTMCEMLRSKTQLHKPGENFKTDGYQVTPNTMNLLKKHLEETGGQVRTRFPPEPNGILHVGHVKAININFGYAAAFNGVCFLRYDDTNPEKEEAKFFDSIKEMVEWLGYTPYKITHSSDYFDQLFEWAVVLINKGLAYVCHQNAEEIKGFNPPPSPWRDRPIEENLQLFYDMKNGKIEEGKATLRMKVVLEEGKQDPIAYRIKFLPHHRTGNKWCIYPTYDYTHCLCDSIENITHSLCTKEFQSRRSSYYWLCNALDIYCPVQWEFGRLNMNYTVVSKRKINKLITEKIAADWSDPRLFTLTALKRRGFPPEAINRFCAQIGVTGAQMSIDPQMLEAVVRDVLNTSAPRTMVVLEPIKVTILNFEGPKELETHYFPNDPSKGSQKIAFSKVIYIEQDDFKEEANDDFKRLTLKQSVGLRHSGKVIKIEKIIKNNEGKIIELQVKAESVETAAKPKAFVHWVAEPANIEVRLYDNLFKHKNPEDPNQVPDGFLSDINSDSLKIVKAYADISLITSINQFKSFQFERIGFFTVDPDTELSYVVFNRTVTLKEDSKK